MLCLIDQDEEAALEAKKKKEAREREDAKRRLSNYKTAKELAQERRKAEEEHAKLVEKEKAKISADQLERIPAPAIRGFRSRSEFSYERFEDDYSLAFPRRLGLGMRRNSSGT